MPAVKAQPPHVTDLVADSRCRLAVWMDTYAHILGSFSKQQEDELRQLKQKLAGMLAK